MMVGALTCPFGTGHMGVTAENVAAENQITREAQDAFALESQDRAAAAIGEGRFAGQIVPVEVTVKREKVGFATDEHPKATTAEALAKLRPAFRKEGTVTAGNASGLNDGAAAIVLATAGAAEKAGLKPKARVLGYAVAGVRPEVMGIGPIPAVRKLLEKTGLAVEDFDVIEFERGLRGPGAGGQPGARARPGEGEPQRRRHRARPSDRGHRGDPDDQGALRARADRREEGARHHVHRRRPGDRAGDRADLRGSRNARPSSLNASLEPDSTAARPHLAMADMGGGGAEVLADRPGMIDARGKRVSDGVRRSLFRCTGSRRGRREAPDAGGSVRGRTAAAHATVAEIAAIAT